MNERLAFGVEPSTRQYRLRLARYQGLAETVAQWVRSRPSTTAPARLLDIGSGNGRTLRYLEAQGVAERVEFFGLEYSDRRIAGMYGRSRWHVLRADAQFEGGLPLADASFDLVVCEQVMEHLAHPQRVIAEIARVLRPGGMMIAGVPSFPPGLAAVRRHVVPRLDRLLGRRGDHVQAFSLRSFLEMIRLAAGDSLAIIEARGFRIVSGGVLAPLEDCRWFWRMNRAIGAAAPSLCTEVQVIARKRAAESSNCDPAAPPLHYAAS